AADAAALHRPHPHAVARVADDEVRLAVRSGSAAPAGQPPHLREDGEVIAEIGLKDVEQAALGLALDVRRQALWEHAGQSASPSVSARIITPERQRLVESGKWKVKRRSHSEERRTCH